MQVSVPPTSPQRRCLHQHPYHSRCVNLALSLSIYIHLHGKATAASGSSTLSCRRMLTDSGLLSYMICTRNFGNSKLHMEGLETATALQKSFLFFFFFGCAGMKLAMWTYISSSVDPKRNDFNSVRVNCLFPCLKKIREWLFLCIWSYDEGDLFAMPMAQETWCQVIIYYH